MNDRILPFSGYTLLRVETRMQLYTTAIDENELRPEDRETEFSWDWIVLKEHEFSVWLSVNIKPSKGIDERVSAAISGDFSFESTEPNVPFESFVCMDAPLLIFPYLREIISELTKRGPYGSYQIPISLITQLIKTNKMEEGVGIEVIREYPEIAASFGISPTMQEDIGKEEKSAKTKAKKPTIRSSKK